MIACSKADDPKPATATYTSLVGRWKFSNATISGEFEIADYSGTITVDNGANDSFSIKGKSYPIITKRSVSGAPPNKFTLFLLGASGNSITLRDCDVNKSYDIITVGSYVYTIQSTGTNGADALTITRK